MIELSNHRREVALAGLWHDYANLFPMLDAAAQDRLREDIQAHGVREPVIVFGGRILDGRNRYMAARDLGLDFPVADFVGTDAEALAYVLSTNLHRRHLTEAQRAAVAAKIANMGRGNPSFDPNSANLRNSVSTAQAAEMLSVGTRSVEAARKVQSEGAPELNAALERGEVSVSAAAAIAALPKEEQSAVVAEGPKAVKAKAKEIREGKAAPVVVAEEAEAADPVDPIEAKARRDLAKLTPGALIDDVIGLRALVAHERAKRREAEAKAQALKDDLSLLADASDMGSKVTRLLDSLRKADGRRKEIEARLARAERHVRALEKERDELRRRLENQIIPMDGAA
jgi:hypothetical protein